jgi:hypothetical protein
MNAVKREVRKSIVILSKHSFAPRKPALSEAEGYLDE